VAHNEQVSGQPGTLKTAPRRQGVRRGASSSSGVPTRSRPPGHVERRNEPAKSRVR
jgi:hypothetical protein